MTDRAGYETYGDDALLRLVCTGDIDALEILFRRDQTMLYQTARGVTHDEQIAEEVVQDCFYKLYRYASRLDTTQPLAPWLYRVTINLCYSRLRRRRLWSEPFHNCLLYTSSEPTRH